MKAKPMAMPLMMLAGWINRHQQDVIVYLKEEKKILPEAAGDRFGCTRGWGGVGC
jgi:hypothetical protein